jgi:hypothetical protein
MKRRNFIKNVMITSGAITLIAPATLLGFTGTKPLTPSKVIPRVHTPLLILHIKEEIGYILRQHIFEPNDVLTRTNVIRQVDIVLKSLLDEGYIKHYAAQCDSENNTPTLIDNNEMQVDVMINCDSISNFINIPVKMGLNTHRNSGYTVGNGDYVSEYAPYLPL